MTSTDTNTTTDIDPRSDLGQKAAGRLDLNGDWHFVDPRWVRFHAATDDDMAKVVWEVPACQPETWHLPASIESLDDFREYISDLGGITPDAV